MREYVRDHTSAGAPLDLDAIDARTNARVVDGTIKSCPGRPHDAHGYCADESCGHEWPVMVIVRLTVEAAPEKNT